MIRIGVIGAGNNGFRHAQYYKESPRTELVAIADPNAEIAQPRADEVGCKLVPDVTDFLGDVDAVVISSPNHLHVPHVQSVTGAGKHVWCEKPMGLTRDDAEAIVDAVRAAGVRSTVGFSVRFGENLQTMIRMVNEGQVGEILSIWSRRLAGSTAMDRVAAAKDKTHWRLDPAKSGGVLYEINVHELDWMMWLGGEVQTVYARKFACDEHPRANDHIWITLDFAGRAVGTHEGSWIAPIGNYYRGLQGGEGTLDTQEWGNTVQYTRRGEERVELELDDAFDLRGHFLDCIEHGAEPVADVEWGRKVMIVADAVIESANSGQLVKL